MLTLRELLEALATVQDLEELAALRDEAGQSLPINDFVTFSKAAIEKARTLQMDLLGKRVADLERAFHDHVQTVPHAPSEA